MGDFRSAISSIKTHGSKLQTTMADPNALPNKRKHPEFTSQQVNQVISFLVERGDLVGGVVELPRGTITDAAKYFDVDKSCISRIWKKAKANRANPDIAYFKASPQKKGRSGRPRLYDREQIGEALRDIPKSDRRTIRSIASKLGIPKSTIGRISKDEEDDNIIAHTNTLKPVLTELNKLTRLMYAANEVEVGPAGGYRFKAGENVVHVDEKWFFMTEECFRMYLAKGELPPVRRVQNKRKIIKVMFLAAVARPRYDETRNCTFDGKIGIWPFAVKRRAQRTSARRPRGTLETKIVNVDMNRYKKMIFEKVLPAIAEKFPRSGSRRTVVEIQQDGARVHFDEADEDWIAASTDDRYRRHYQFLLKDQPANSPDCNILDLGFFRALQSEQFKLVPAANVDELMANVRQAWDAFEPRKLYYNWITHQTVMEQILLHKGDNTFSIPHVGKERLDRHGALPKQFHVSELAASELEEGGWLD